MLRYLRLAASIVLLMPMLAGSSSAAAPLSHGLRPLALGQCPVRPNSAKADTVDRFAVRAMLSENAPGASVVIVQNGRVKKLRAYGYADLESCVPATPRTLFGIGSISKQFTAVGALMLVRDGVIGLDDPITKYLPEGRGVWDGITVRHLLTHTSGIPDYCGDDRKFPSMKLDRTSNPSTEDLLEQIAKSPLNFRPGDDWAYSNTGYVVLSALIERASKMPFPKFMHDRIFEPLGMNATRYSSPTAVIPSRATGYMIYDPSGPIVHGAFISDQFSRWGDTGMLSTASDMARWIAALGSDRLLSATLWRAMTTPVRLNDGSLQPYGFGMDLGQVGEERLWSHGGSFRVGYTSMLAYFPDRRLGVVTLANINGESSPAVEIALDAIGTTAPDLAPSSMRSPRMDPHPKLTASLLALLKGADEAAGAAAMTTAFARHDLIHKIAPHMLSAPNTTPKLLFLNCGPVHGTTPAAFGTAVTHQCQYRLTGASGGPPGITFWLTDADEVAGISFW